MAAILFFWDYDTQWGADRSRLPTPREWGPLEFPNTDELLDIHAEFGVPACFAVVDAAALPGSRPYHDPGQIRRIHAAGHEIASHSFSHEWLPGLDRRALLDTLRNSKDALEQCIGAPIVSFVPPFNQPFDYAAGWSFSLSERRQAGVRRTTLRKLCEALGETGYRFCRVTYASLGERLSNLVGRPGFRPRPPLEIAGITCVRAGDGGFALEDVAGLVRRSQGRSLIALYGHPHSLHFSESTQSATTLRRTLMAITDPDTADATPCLLPRQLIE
jgi:hypothetical protein